MALRIMYIPQSGSSYPMVMKNSNKIKELYYVRNRYYDILGNDVTGSVDMITYFTGYPRGSI